MKGNVHDLFVSIGHLNFTLSRHCLHESNNVKGTVAIFFFGSKNNQEQVIMSSPEIMNSSDYDIFLIEEIRPAHKNVHREVEEDFTCVQLKKKPSPSRKSSKKRKRGNEKTNTNVSVKETKSTMSANVYNQESGKSKKISVDTCGKNKNSSVNTNVVEQKTKKTNLQLSQESTSFNDSVRNGSPSKISDYFKSPNATPEKQNSSKKQTEVKSFQHSPTIIRRRKRFFMPKDNLISSPQKSYQRKIFDNSLSNEGCDKSKPNSPSDDSQKFDFSLTTLNETSVETISDSSECQDSTKINIEDSGDQMMENEFYNQNTEILCGILKDIIHDELEKQIDLKFKRNVDGKAFENLLSNEEVAVLRKFFLLEKNACKLYVRMLLRTKGLYRVSAINYKDISADLEEEFKLLEKANFVNVNPDEEDLQTQMNLLNVTEISKLHKKFKVFTKSKNKSDLICSLIKNCQKQKSVLDYFGKAKECSRLEMLKKEVKSMLGMCIKLNESVKSAFQRVFLLFSFAHYFGLEEKRISDQVYMCLKVKKQYLKFPQYELTQTVIFQCRSDFLQYEKALWMMDSLDSAINSKNNEDVCSIANEARREFNEILNDDHFQKRLSNLPPFLMKFNAGSVYARILTKYCAKLKRIKDNNEVISIIRMLLDQNLFLTSKRGEWYEILSQAFLKLKNNEAAIKVLIESQKDSFVNEVQKFNLQLKGQAILKKRQEFQDIFINELDLFSVSIQEPLSIKISSKIMEGNKAGYKAVFMEESEKSVSYMSVEERALSHYKSIGFTKGYHGENYIVKTIYFLLFNDIIYGPSPPGAFQSAYQQHPLDFYSKSFYSYRKESIDLLLDEMCKWTNEVVEEKLTTSYNNNFNVYGIMNWGSHFKNPEKNLETVKMFVEFLECITIPVFVQICRRLLENFRVYSSGFPDLTLWDPESKKCKFVEVKGPNDKLSPAQRIWLNFLETNGIDCEVCYVQCRRCNRPRRALRLRTAGKRRQNFCQLHLERCISEKHMTVVMSNSNGVLFVQKLVTN